MQSSVSRQLPFFVRSILLMLMLFAANKIKIFTQSYNSDVTVSWTINHFFLYFITSDLFIVCSNLKTDSTLGAYSENVVLKSGDWIPWQIFRGFPQSVHAIAGRRPFASIHSFSSLSYDRSRASSKASSPHSAIQSLLFQRRVSSPFLKVIQ
jgi:hypothetical protein